MNPPRRPRHEEQVIRVLEQAIIEEKREKLEEQYLTADNITKKISARKKPTPNQVIGILRRLVTNGRVIRSQEVSWKASEYRLRGNHG